eukprot:TRINITY_DN64942_c0_g1_i1.p1 TRINITY_DN64942_c0_g1~~TRINITY_DN64942_c0_g1_i1.p1  ORF type:complete len:432 (+),score=60.83 TRINITY_DN64942_c0_g1_i1:98-1297(+)
MGGSCCGWRHADVTETQWTAAGATEGAGDRHGMRSIAVDPRVSPTRAPSSGENTPTPGEHGSAGTCPPRIMTQPNSQTTFFPPVELGRSAQAAALNPLRLRAAALLGRTREPLQVLTVRSEESEPLSAVFVHDLACSVHFAGAAVPPVAREGPLALSFSVHSASARASSSESPATPWTPGPGRVCVVLDFDLTLAACHVHKELRRTGFMARPQALGLELIFGSAGRQEMIRDFLKRLRSLDAYVAVLTNNSEDIVRECLELGGYAEFVHEVLVAERDKGSDMRKLRPPGVARWIFVDDDMRNIRSVQHATRQRVPCVHIDGGSGMQQHHIDRVEQLLTNPGLLTFSAHAGSTAAATSTTPSLTSPYIPGQTWPHGEGSMATTATATGDKSSESVSAAPP